MGRTFSTSHSTNQLFSQGPAVHVTCAEFSQLLLEWWKEAESHRKVLKWFSFAAPTIGPDFDLSFDKLIEF